MENHSTEEHNQGDQLSEISDDLTKNLTLESSDDDEDDVVYVIDDVDDEDDGGGEFEFSLGGEEVKSPASAEELFDKGKIKPTIPYYLAEEAPAVKKVLVVSEGAEEEGPYCVWSTETTEEAATAPSVPEMSRKSNSTGFSRLWRVKDLLVRSNSDGKDTFVFLPRKGTEKKKNKMMKVVNLKRIKKVGNEDETSSSSSSSSSKEKKSSMSVAYEALYGKKKVGDKSYLPYRLGFFTNANGITKNVHPY